MWLGATADLPDAAELPPCKEKECYALNVSSTGALIVAGNEVGLFYGAQTLMQLLEQSHREKTGLPGMAVKDWPTFDWRGRYFDGSQFIGSVVVTRANLEREIKLMARFKLNYLKCPSLQRWFCLVQCDVFAGDALPEELIRRMMT